MAKYQAPPEPPAAKRRSFGLVDHRAHWEELKGHFPPWKRKLLVVALVIAIIGFGGQITAKLLRSRAPVSNANTPLRHSPGMTGSASGTTVEAPTPAPIPNGSYVPAPVLSPSTVPNASPPSSSPTLTEKISPWMGRIGISFVIGIVLGTVFRVFVKIMVLLALLAQLPQLCDAIGLDDSTEAVFHANVFTTFSNIGRLLGRYSPR